MTVVVNLSVPLNREISTLFCLLGFLDVPCCLRCCITKGGGVFTGVSCFSLYLFVFLRALSIGKGNILPCGFIVWC